MKRTNGGNGGYARKSKVPKDNPRTPKNAGKGRSGANTAQRRAQDGTRANARGK